MSLQAELDAFGIAQRALKAGDRAPDFSSPDARGGHVRLNGLLPAGPVVLSFTRLGATLVAVSPQTPDESLSTAEKNALPFPVLSDAGSATSKSFGIAYDLAEESPGA
jgi:peroxiredoxin